MKKQARKQTTKSGNILGILAAITVLLFGGWSGALVGWLVGVGAGVMACQGKRVPVPKVGARLGTRAGLVLGVWILVASLIEGLILRSASGRPTPGVIQALIFGIVGLVVATVAGGITGWLQGLGKNRQKATLGLLALILITFPFLDQAAQTNWIEQVITILIFALLALGLNIVVGYAGLLDLGYAAFFAIGAYTTGLLSSPFLGVEWNFWIVIWIAAAVAAVAGVILGSPTLPLRGDYLAIVTLGFGEIVPIVFRNLTSVQIYEPISKTIGGLIGRPEMAICLLGCEKAINLTGGEAGINPIGRPSLPFVGTFQAGQFLPWYYLILSLVVGSTFMISRLRGSRLGRAWTAIREDELAASAMGINLVRTKLLAFAMGATFSGFAGAFYGAYISAIFPSVFGFDVSVIILCMVILGGLGSIPGVLLGCLLITSADRLFLPQLAQVLKGLLNTSVLPNIGNPALKDFLAVSVDPIQMRLFLFGLTLVIMMIIRPEGLVPSAERQAELHSDEGALNESLADARSQ